MIEKGNDNYYLMGTTDHSSFPGGGGTIGGTKGRAFATSTLPTNSWTYLATSYDGANVRLYLNGTLVAIQAKTGAITSSTNALTIGSDPFYGQYFNGLIDNLRVYNTALSQAQIQTDMTTPVATSGPDTSPAERAWRVVGVVCDAVGGDVVVGCVDGQCGCGGLSPVCEWCWGRDDCVDELCVLGLQLWHELHAWAWMPMTLPATARPSRRGS